MPGTTDIRRYHSPDYTGYNVTMLGFGKKKSKSETEPPKPEIPAASLFSRMRQGLGRTRSTFTDG
ncbi:MAG: hypothetical protein WD668_11165, partial [Saccharospirillum sp.]